LPKFYGQVGYAVPVDKGYGVTEDVIVEIGYYGDVLRNTRGMADGEVANNDLSVSNSISIISNPYAQNNMFAMRYVKWKGARWKVLDVDASRPPRLILRIGEVYDGPIPTPATSSSS